MSDTSGFSTGMHVAIAEARNVARKERSQRMVITAIDEESGTITVERLAN